MGDLSVAVKVPSFPTAGSAVVLEADLDLGGNTLESIKWFKDDNEFYTVTPKGTTTKYVSGIQVDMKNSSRVKVTLLKVTEATSGMYKCELRAGGRMMMKGAGMKVQSK
ncbi:hypothetical protein PPYR_03059 [Photinus pyralis]|uniref:Ig-like domain-containing protein n=1 Tax=Photinus pyralis TaxID=7054 RepID=A0A1Y1LBW7_PHOPY|nr:uncharacterized protein LOC116162321 isoform X2 [Photinus pyralis]KAB0791259.1 hypothetical protein PPYR_03059 [Photinus pyralis]